MSRLSQLTLLDGTLVEFDEAGPDDVEAVVAFTLTLSKESRHLRFFAGSRSEVVECEIRRELLDERNVSVVARAPGDGRVVGHALGARFAEDHAELAFAVADDLQHHGLGTLLLHAVMHELRMRGVKHFRALTLAENRAMRGVFAGAGFKLHAQTGAVDASLDEAG
jgi:GNAT superfamily N-acetyltransferase